MAVFVDTNTTWLIESEEKVLILALHVQPGAKRSALVGQHGERLKIALSTPPVDGKANQALIKFLAGILHLPKSSFTLLCGQTNREKRLKVRGLSRQQLLTAFDSAVKN